MKYSDPIRECISCIEQMEQQDLYPEHTDRARAELAELRKDRKRLNRLLESINDPILDCVDILHHAGYNVGRGEKMERKHIDATISEAEPCKDTS